MRDVKHDLHYSQDSHSQMPNIHNAWILNVQFILWSVCKLQRPVSIWRPSFRGMGIPMLKIRWLWDRLIFNMGIPILVRQHFCIVSGIQSVMILKYHNISYRCEANLVWNSKYFNYKMVGEKSVATLVSLLQLFLRKWGWLHLTWSNNTSVIFWTYLHWQTEVPSIGILVKHYILGNQV